MWKWALIPTATAAAVLLISPPFAFICSHSDFCFSDHKWNRLPFLSTRCRVLLAGGLTWPRYRLLPLALQIYSKSGETISKD